MSLDHNMIEKIERFTRGKMSVEEREAFEKEINASAPLQRQVELSMMVDQMVVANEALKLKQQMKKDLYKPRPNYGMYLGVTLLVLCAGVGAGLMLNRESESLEQKIVSPVADEQPKVYSPIKQDEETPLTAQNEKKAVDKKADQSLSSIESVKNEPEPQALSEHIVNKEEPKSVLHSEVLESRKTEKHEEPVHVPKKIDHCATLLPNVEFTVTPTCKGERSGEVYIHTESVKGGTAPYEFVLGTMHAASHFSHLASGTYELKIKDALNCVVESNRKVVVYEKVCKVVQQHVFNPEYDQSWSIPYDKDKAATHIKIVDKGGRTFYESQVAASYPAEWRGESSTGLVLAHGLYFYTIMYGDNTVDEGTIMITK